MERRLTDGAAVLTVRATVLTVHGTVLTAHEIGLTAHELGLTAHELGLTAHELGLTTHELGLTAHETIDAASETVVNRPTNADSFDDAADCGCEKRRQFSDKARARCAVISQLAVDADVHDIAIRSFVFDIDSAAVAGVLSIVKYAEDACVPSVLQI